MNRFIPFLLLASVLSVQAAEVEDYEAALLAGQYEKAKIIHSTMREAGTVDDAKLSELVALMYQFQYADEFQAARERYLKSKSADDLNSLRAVHSDWMMNGPNRFQVSQHTLDEINQRQATAREQMESINEADAKMAQEKERAQMAEMERREAAEQAAEEAAYKARQDECGADMNKPRIGMTVPRAKRCLGGLTMLGQLNRADGVITQYRVGDIYLNVMEGRIVSWDRF